MDKKGMSYSNPIVILYLKAETKRVTKIEQEHETIAGWAVWPDCAGNWW